MDSMISSHGAAICCSEHNPSPTRPSTKPNGSPFGLFFCFRTYLELVIFAPSDDGVDLENGAQRVITFYCHSGLDPESRNVFCARTLDSGFRQNDSEVIELSCLFSES